LIDRRALRRQQIFPVQPVKRFNAKGRAGPPRLFPCPGTNYASRADQAPKEPHAHRFYFGSSGWSNERESAFVARHYIKTLLNIDDQSRWNKIVNSRCLIRYFHLIRTRIDPDFSRSQYQEHGKDPALSVEFNFIKSSAGSIRHSVKICTLMQSNAAISNN
jgi:hypothetical protein